MKKNLQIGFKSEYSKGMGRMMIYYGNTTTQPITNFRAETSSTRSVSANAQPVDTVIQPRTQAQQLIAINCLGTDFNGFSQLNLNFVSNGRPVHLTIKLPVGICKFFEPTQMNGPTFFQQWKLIENSPQSEQAIVKSARPVDIPWLSKILSNGFHFAVLQGVDPNANNVVAVATFTYASAAVVCLLRIETNAAAQMYRVTVKSSDGQVTAGVKDLLSMQLS